MTREYNFDGIAGPTHNYAGLSPGNLASQRHEGEVGNPRAAALQGLEKMRFVASLGVGQAVLPPQPRPCLTTLRRLGFSGSDRGVLGAAAAGDGHWLRLCSSASAMWTANAATVAPSPDTRDGRLHLTPANLTAMFHRSLEASTTTRILRAIFADPARFCVHDPLPSVPHLADEGAANHTRLSGKRGTAHLFAWGRQGFGEAAGPQRFPARQTLEASRAVIRLHQLDNALTWQQAPAGIDVGAFHSDVLCVGNDSFLMLHEHAFVDTQRLLAELDQRVGISHVLASESELPVADAVGAYPFNSQLLTLPSGRMAIVAPSESENNPAARRFLERVVSSDNPVDAVHYTGVNASMNNGGGPACLRLRVPLGETERGAIRARVFFDDPLYVDLKAWVMRHYRDRLSLDDLADPELLREGHTALDELTRLLALGSVYDFQRN